MLPPTITSSTSHGSSSESPVRLYFGNLAFDKGDNDVREIFFHCGEILDIHIIRDRFTNRSQGYGFITFVDPAAKDKALLLDGKSFFGRPLKVNLESKIRDRSSRVKTRQRLFVKNIPLEKNEEDVKEIFSQFGKVENFFFIKDHNTGISRGFGFLDYSNAAEAQAALSLNDKEVFGTTLTVKVAEAKNARAKARAGNFGRENLACYAAAARMKAESQPADLLRSIRKGELTLRDTLSMTYPEGVPPGPIGPTGRAIRGLRLYPATSHLFSTAPAGYCWGRHLACFSPYTTAQVYPWQASASLAYGRSFVRPSWRAI
jgi:RNA recognition motif-containing protein